MDVGVGTFADINKINLMFEALIIELFIWAGPQNPPNAHCMSLQCVKLIFDLLLKLLIHFSPPTRI